MGLPEPTLVFTIPSVYDDTTLDCRLYLPTFERLDEGKLRAAIVAHPYAPLGGCCDDAVVALTGGEILKTGYVLCTFDFRGAGGSHGRTSWSGKPEVADYCSVVGFLVYFLTVHDNNPIQLVLGGYSYGSIVASHTPPLDELLKQYHDAAEGSAHFEITRRARHLATQVRSELASKPTDPTNEAPMPVPRKHGQMLQVGGEETSPEKRRRSFERPKLSNELRRSVDLVRRLSHIGPKAHGAQQPELREHKAEELPAPIVEPAYLLISPLLPPSSLIAYSLGHRGQQKEELQQRLSVHPSLAVYGSSDLFTSARRLRPWAKSIGDRPSSNFTYVEVDGAGHFWHEPCVDKRLRLAVREWMKQLVE